MKKFITLTLIAIIIMLLAGCKKEKEEFSLVGKTFAAFNYSMTLWGEKSDVYKIWRFVSETEVEESGRENSPQGAIIGKLYYGTYTLDYPHLNALINTGATSKTEFQCEFISETCFRTQWYDLSGRLEIHEFHLQ
ncbi:MAG: hypothetical protein NC308_09680 [Clostridium sp.]|nr:hypothetical protein [Bacteroides sp.]MCM1199147.1 hypothetical protein [Clostridium sp.]